MRLLPGDISIALVFECDGGIAWLASGGAATVLSCGPGVFRLGIANIASNRRSWPPWRPALLLAVCPITRAAGTAVTESTVANRTTWGIPTPRRGTGVLQRKCRTSP